MFSAASNRVFLPAALEEYIATALSFPDLVHVQFRLCRRIPFSWLVGGKRLAGLTLWNRIYVLSEWWPQEPLTQLNVELVIHELVHVLQYRRNPIKFPLRYVIDYFRYGYENNPAEAEARQVAARLTESFFRSHA